MGKNTGKKRNMEKIKNQTQPNKNCTQSPTQIIIKKREVCVKMGAGGELEGGKRGDKITVGLKRVEQNPWGKPQEEKKKKKKGEVVDTEMDCPVGGTVAESAVCG